MSGTRFMVQWEEHPSHLASRLGQLLEHQTLVDVTLMCNTHTLKVHRAVLAACSPYFETLLQSIFQRQLGQHPLIVLKDMQFSVLKSLIEFMYCGETNVTEDDLGALLQAARFFQVKGLSSMSREALGIPAPKSKSTINGDATKSTNKTRTLESENKVIAQSSIDHNQAISEEASINEKLVSRPGPEASADTAQVLLSLSGEIDSIRASSKEEDKTAAEDAAMAVAKAQEEEEAAANAEAANAVHSANQAAPVTHSSQVPPGGYPIYVPGPRKRGRPLKRQMNLIFQEKVMTDAEMALRKEAEASRKALEALQKEMSARDSPSSETPTNIGLAGRSRGGRNVVQHRVQQVTQLGQTRQIAQVRDRVSNPTSGNVITTTSANQSTNATTAVANVSNSTAGGTVMTQYMEVLKEAGLPTDVPILMDSGDGSFVTVNEEVLMNIVSGGVIQCHVEEGGSIATFTPGDARVMTSEVQEDNAEGVVQAVEGQNEIENADHRELITAKEEADGLTMQGQVRGQDMPSVDGDEAVGEANIAFSENETVVQEVEGKEGEGGDTIYMVVEDGSGAVEGQQVITHDGVPLCKVKAETVEGKTMYLVTRDATKTMQCAISEGALVVSEGDVVQGISIASDVDLERSDKASLVKKVEYEKIVQLPSLDDNDGGLQDTVVPTSEEVKSTEENISSHITELSKSSEELVSVVTSDVVTESDVPKDEYSEAALSHSPESKEKMQHSPGFEQFVTGVASTSPDVVPNKRKAEGTLPSLNKRVKEVEEEDDSLVLVLKDEEMDESSANTGENQTEFLIASSENAESETCKEQLQDSLSSEVPVGDFQGKVELATGPSREGRSLPMLQDSDEDIKSSTM